jgi:hypothetical protein
VRLVDPNEQAVQSPDDKDKPDTAVSSPDAKAENKFEAAILLAVAGLWMMNEREHTGG